MNTADIILILIIAVIIIIAAILLIRKKHIGVSCCGDCSNCEKRPSKGLKRK